MCQHEALLLSMKEVDDEKLPLKYRMLTALSLSRDPIFLRKLRDLIDKMP
jgi:hypothetical protein